MANLRLDQLTASSTAFADTDIIPTVENVATTHTHKSKAWSVVKSTLKTYFDGLYAVLGSGQTKVVSAQIYLSAAGMSPQVTTGCAAIAAVSMGTNKQDVRVLAFDKDAIEYAQSVFFRMPSDYAGGTITYSIDWAHPATTTNFKVAWAVDAVSYADDAALDAAWGTAIQVNDTGGTTSDYYATPASAALTIGGSPASNALTIIRVQRVATDGTNDTLAVDAYFIGLQINYTRT